MKLADRFRFWRINYLITRDLGGSHWNAIRFLLTGRTGTFRLRWRP